MLELTLERGSRQESFAAWAALERGESLYLDGKVAEAFRSMERTAAEYPDQPSVVQKARERLREWRKAAADARLRLEAEALELRRMPTAVLYDSLMSRLAALAAKFEGTEEGARAEQLRKETAAFWSDLRETRADAGLQDLLERGKRHFALDELALAELYLRWVAEGDAEGEMGNEARSTLKLIETRRDRNRQLILR